MIAVLQNIALGASVGLAGQGQAAAAVDTPVVPGDGSFWDMLLQADKPNGPKPQEGMPDLHDADEKSDSLGEDLTMPVPVAAAVIPFPAPGLVLADMQAAFVAGQVAIAGQRSGDTPDPAAPSVAEPVIAADQGPQSSTVPLPIESPLAAVKTGEASVDSRAAPDDTSRPATPAQLPDQESLTAGTAAVSRDATSALPPTTLPPLSPAAPQPEPGPALGDGSKMDVSDRLAVATHENAEPETADVPPTAAVSQGDRALKAKPSVRPALDPAPTDPAPTQNAVIATPQVTMAEAFWRQKLDGTDPAPTKIAETASLSRETTAKPAILTPEMPPGLQPLSSPVQTSDGTRPLSSDDKGVAISGSEQTVAMQTATPDTPLQDADVIAVPAQPEPAQSGPDLTRSDAAETIMAPTLGPVAPPSGQLSARATALPLPAPVAARDLAPAIVEMTRTGKDGPLELALAPEELGRLTISLRQEGDFLRVSMIAERPETLDLLRRHAGDFLADLRQSGFSGASFSFGQSGQNQTPRFGSNPLGADGAGPAQSAALDFKNSPVNRPQHGAGLDLRF